MIPDLQKWGRTLASLVAYAFLIAVTAIFAPVSAQGQPETVVSEGVAAIIGDNPAAARDKAIDDALRKAVEQTVGTMVSSDTLVEQYRVIHDKVIARTSGYVRRYTVLSENTEENLLRVRIQAEIALTNLTSDLQSLGLLHTLAEKPKVMVVIVEERVGGLYGTDAYVVVGQAESSIMEQLIKAGFNVVDSQTVINNISRDQALRILEGDDMATAAAALQYGAQIVITGKSYSKNARGPMNNTNLQSIQATVQARVIRSDDAKVISSRSAQGSQVHIDELQGGALAIKKACIKLSNELIADIARNWQGDIYGRQKEITLMITGLVSYRHLSEIKRFLEKEMQGVHGVHQRSYVGGAAELMLDYAGKSSNIADELANRKFAGFRLEPTNVTPSRVDVKAVVEK